MGVLRGGEEGGREGGACRTQEVMYVLRDMKDV